MLLTTKPPLSNPCPYQNVFNKPPLFFTLLHPNSPVYGSQGSGFTWVEVPKKVGNSSGCHRQASGATVPSHCTDKATPGHMCHTLRITQELNPRSALSFHGIPVLPGLPDRDGFSAKVLDPLKTHCGSRWCLDTT